CSFHARSTSISFGNAREFESPRQLDARNLDIGQDEELACLLEQKPPLPVSRSGKLLTVFIPLLLRRERRRALFTGLAGSSIRFLCAVLEAPRSDAPLCQKYLAPD